MKIRTYLPLIVIVLVTLGLPMSSASAADGGAVLQTTRSVNNVTTEPLSELYRNAQQDGSALGARAHQRRDARVMRRLDLPPSRAAGPVVDTVVQSSVPAAAGSGGGSMPPPIQTFEGIGNVNGVLPPDTDGDVGPNHYVQMVNLSMAIWDKSGNPLLGPVASNVLWDSLGGICASNNDGDPIVLYDRQADRWMLSQFALAFPDNFHECVAISATGDPTGTWHLYDFKISDTKFNDYPHFGVWPDAYYMSVNQFDGTTQAWAGVGAVAFERDQMLQGLPAQMVYFDLGPTAAPSGMLPADLDGSTPPPSGAPEPFAYIKGTSEIEIWDFSVDWTTPANSTFAPQVTLPVSAFDRNMCGGSRNCIPQPGGTALDAIADRAMYRLQYRNFGTHQSMVFNHTVDENGSDHAGVRWYELRDIGAGWSVHQQATYAPDADHRWMGSIATDKDGNIALGYSVSSTTTHPSIRYAGRLAGDPLGTLPQAEASLIAGGGSQSHSSGRWGDYSAMTVDPADDCTFWYTQEYYAADSSAGWQTRIGSFRFPSCTNGPVGSLQGTVTQSANGDPIDGAQVTADAFSTATDALGAYTFASLPVGTYAVSASASGFLDSPVQNVAVADGGVSTQNFTLATAPPFTISGTVTDGSGQGWPLYARVESNTLPPGSEVFTSPVTGQYSLTVSQGQDVSLTATAEAGDYIAANRVISATPGNEVQDFALLVDTSVCTAQGYEREQDSFHEDFESGFTNWSMSGLWNPELQTDSCGSTAAPFPNPVTAAYYGIDGSCNYDTGASTSGSLTMLTDFTVTAGLQLTFESYQQTECGGGSCGYDGRTVEISTDGGSSWALLHTLNTPEFSWETVTQDLSAYAGQSARLRFSFDSGDEIDNAYLGWMVDDIAVGGSCGPIPGGGLVSGNVYDANTGDGVNQALVDDGAGGHFSESVPTPDDPALDDGLYSLFSLTGNQTISAQAVGYGSDSQTVAVPGGAVSLANLQLPAALLQVDPAQLDTEGGQDQTWNEPLSLDNLGDFAVNFEVKEFNFPYLAPVATGPFADNGRRTSPKHLGDRDARALRVPQAVDAIPLAAGDVVQVWPTGLVGSWGIGYDLDATDLWVGNILALGGDDLNYRFLPNGTNTEDTIDTSTWVAAFAADMTYNPTTGMLWQVNVDGDNCIYEMDPATQVSTGNTICPSFGTSERGLAYDVVSNTYYAGSWNDAVINHFAADGTILDSANVGLNIAGLAYNPDTGHLFVTANAAAPAFDIYVLDVNNGYAIVGGFDVIGLGDGAQAGLEMGCSGSLWAVNQATHEVFEVESGETTSMCSSDIPWLSVTPATGGVAAASSQPLSVDIDTSGMAPGLYQAHLRIVNDGPYGDVIVPVDLTVNQSVPSSADLAISKTSSPNPVAAGATLTYTVTVDNLGPSDASDVSVTDTLPAEVGSANTTGCAADPNGVPTCSLGTIAAGGSAQYSITVTVDSGVADGSIITNVATVNSTTPDPDGSNNTVTEATDVVSGEIRIQPSRIDSQQDPDTSYTQSVVISNDGGAALGITAVFESSDNCSSSTDLPWLSHNETPPIAIVPGDSSVLDVTLDSTGQAGTLSGSICIDDPNEPIVELPVTMEVLAAKVNRCSAADFDGNSVIDSQDLGTVFAHWSQTVPASTNGDFDGNGIVTANDYIQVVSCMGTELL